MASGSEKGVKRLSGNVLDMKFMKRTKLRIEEDVRKAEERKKQAEYLKLVDTSTSDNPKCKIIEYEQRIEVLEKLVFGRMSFKGFNADIEKFMKYHERVRSGEEEDANESKDVGDEELAARWGAEATVGRKFTTKGQRKINESALIDEAVRPGKRSLQKGGTETGSKRSRTN